MPSIFTPIPSEVERKSPGAGGKPPVDRRPTGGGGGGGDDDWRSPRHGPREALNRTRAFVFCALAGDMMFFVVLVALFYARQAGTHMDARTLQQIGDWRPVLLPPILFLNTAVLLLSGLSMERARRHIFREFDVLEEWLGLGRPALRRTIPWIATTLALGLLFLAGQVIAWRQLTAEGFAFDRWATPASYFFYLITGLHAAHLALGMLALLFCLCALSRLQRVESRQIAVDSAAWFWHIMALAWLVLFAVLLLGQ
ncbi:MAG: cytochrome c oxidase subunit 3 [Terracidiphilus sp.]|jgi:cytochrome c oxidase subunit 3